MFVAVAEVGNEFIGNMDIGNADITTADAKHQIVETFVYIHNSVQAMMNRVAASTGGAGRHSDQED